MPELVAKGPNIPARLMNELDDGNAVFFCGAGVSMGPESGLPNFNRLVRDVYKTKHLTPDIVEREALDCDEKNAARRRPQLDKALNLLERPERLGTVQLRRCVLALLSKPPCGPLVTHKALIELSRNKQGIRLVTTNFDSRFVEAGIDEKMVDAAPKLPWPKRHNWSSVVHLHGRICGDSGGTDLVLTAADFGRAYLTEQWAARFVTELFREFTIVFIGYSLDDPVMGYMVDALAAERSRGARFRSAYAFADYDGTDANKERTENAWRAKNVVPVLYDKQGDHGLLRQTLTEWARIRKDSFRARTQIALNEMSKLPSGPDDPVVERVVWALRDPVAAERLADREPLTDERDFPTLKEWLDIFADAGLLSCTENLDEAAVDGANSHVQLVDGGEHTQNPPKLGRVTRHLARWIALHLHVPQVLTWVLERGGKMHPTLHWLVRRRLIESAVQIPCELRHFWTVLSDTELIYHEPFLWPPASLQQTASEAERRRLNEQVVKSIAPRYVVRPGPSWHRRFQQSLGGKERALSAVDSCAHLELSIGDKDLVHRIDNILKDPGFLAGNAMTLTSYLETALTLLEDMNGRPQDSGRYRPSIASHKQNRHRADWTYIIDLVRDTYLVLFHKDRALAANLLERWVLSRQPLFKRLALHALTENINSDIRIARKLLITGRKPGLWEPELRREVLRFLRLAGQRLPRNLRVDIVRKVHAGPKTGPWKSWPHGNEMVRNEKALRLGKLAASGAKLDRRSKALADEWIAVESDNERDEFLSWGSEAHWIDPAEFAPPDLVGGSAQELVRAFQGEYIGDMPLEGLIRRRPVKVARALRQLADQGDYPERYWQLFLWHVQGRTNTQKPTARLQDYAACVLANAPAALFAGVDSAAAGFVVNLAERYDIDREPSLLALWQKAWEGAPEAKPNGNDPSDQALTNATGRLAEAALTRLWKYGPTVHGTLPVAVRPYFDEIASDPKGHWGRFNLVLRLYDLFAIDPHWTREFLLSRLEPTQQAAEAYALWAAYALSPKVGPDLLAAFKQPLLRVLKTLDRVSEHARDRLVELFMVICLEAPSELAEDEVRDVVNSLTDDALPAVLDSLRKRLNGDPTERGQIWKNGLLPWLKHYWPNEGARNTPATSREMLLLLLECGDAFSDAVGEFSQHLKPGDQYGLYTLKESAYVSKYPGPFFEVLKHVLGPEPILLSSQYLIQEILDSLKEALPQLEADTDFQDLYRRATS